jgi:DNA-binding GntR family transcriptional regulator
VDDQVIGYDRRYFPPSIAGRFDPAFVTDRPITELVGEIAGSVPTRSEVEVEIHTAMEEVADELGITPGMLTVSVGATHYLADGTPVQTIVHSYRIDRVRFRSSARYRPPLRFNSVELESPSQAVHARRATVCSRQLRCRVEA